MKRVDKQTDSRVICLDMDPKRKRKKMDPVLEQV